MKNKMLLLVFCVLVLTISINSYAATFSYDEQIDKEFSDICNQMNNYIKTFMPAQFSQATQLTVSMFVTPTESAKLTGSQFEVVADCFEFYRCSNMNYVGLSSVILEVFDGVTWQPISGVNAGTNYIFNIADLTPYISSTTIPVRLSWIQGQGDTRNAVFFGNNNTSVQSTFDADVALITSVTNGFLNTFFNGTDNGSTQKNGRRGVFNFVGKPTFDPSRPYEYDAYVDVSDLVLYETIYNIHVDPVAVPTPTPTPTPTSTSTPTPTSTHINLADAVIMMGDSINYQSNLPVLVPAPTLNWTKTNSNINFSSDLVANPDLTGINTGIVDITLTEKNGSILLNSYNSTISVIDVSSMKKFLVEKGGLAVLQEIPIIVPVGAIVDYDNFAFNLSGPPGFLTDINYSFSRVGDNHILNISGLSKTVLNLTLTINYSNTLLPGGPITSKDIPIEVDSVSIDSNIGEKVFLFKESSVNYNLTIAPITLGELNLNTHQTDSSIVAITKITDLNLIVSSLNEGVTDVITTLESPMTHVGKVIFKSNVDVIYVNDIPQINAYENKIDSIPIPISFGNEIDLNKLTVELLNTDVTIFNETYISYSITKSPNDINLNFQVFDIGQDSIIKKAKLKYTYENPSGIITTLEKPLLILFVENSLPE